MNQLCKVCGEPAAGFHFGAFTCEGCKSFFGRTYNNLSTVNECKNNGSCTINKKNRTSCKACRLRKCLIVGMSKNGSRYGRRSNWFKIHCLLQEQASLDSTLQGFQLSNALTDALEISLDKHPKSVDVELSDEHMNKDNNHSLLSSPESQFSETSSIEASAKYRFSNSAKEANSPSYQFVNGSNHIPVKIYPPYFHSLYDRTLSVQPLNNQISKSSCPKNVSHQESYRDPYLVQKESSLPMESEQKTPIDLSLRKFLNKNQEQCSDVNVNHTDIAYNECICSSIPLDLRKRSDLSLPASAS